MTRYLVTGAHGQVGRELTRLLHGRADVQLFAAARDELDITDRAAVIAAAETFRPDFIINAAAYTAVDQAEREAAAARAVNTDGTRHLAEAAHTVGAVFLHLSTDYVFDGNADSPYTETDAPAPQSVYGQTKLDGETAALSACPKSIILRTSWVFGAHGGNFVKTMLRLGRERDTLGIVADQRGAPTHAGDIAAALITIAGHIQAGRPADYGLYHFSGSPYVSWHGFAAEIFRRAAAQGILPRSPQLNAIATADYPTPARRPANSCLNTDKIQTAFGIAPSDWQAALADLRPYAA